MELLHTLFYVAIGGAIGAINRVAFSVWLNPKDPHSIPWGTLIINFLSCFILGIILNFNLSPELQIFLITGFLGAFSTFSSIMWECARFKKKPLKILVYLLATIGAGFFGYELGGYCI